MMRGLRLILLCSLRVRYKALEFGDLIGLGVGFDALDKTDPKINGFRISSTISS